MHQNPFSPSFSIHPNMFFGRKEQISRFEKALDTPGSADRCFFLTGTRGCGKTSLLHQYALRAANRRWQVIEATSADALDQMLHYVKLDKSTAKSAELVPSVSIAGTAAISLGSVSASSAVENATSLLSQALCKKLRSSKVKRGLAIIIDEAQKIRREEIVHIGNAVQQARTEGLDIALVLGGLPNAYSKIRGYRDCTFLRRMRREELWCMKKSETIDLLVTMFAKVPEIAMNDEQIASIGQFTGGHPYLLQLVGDSIYTLVERSYAPERGMTVAVDDALIAEAQLKALLPYKNNVVDDALTGAHKSTREYIRIAFELRDETGLIKLSDINNRYGDSPANMNSRRAYALNTQVLRPVRRGFLRFALPHYDLAFEDVDPDDERDLDDEWEF